MRAQYCYASPSIPSDMLTSLNARVLFLLKASPDPSISCTFYTGESLAELRDIGASGV